MVLTVDAVRLTLHKETHPDDSDEPNDIGLSSEEETEEMEESEHIRRKYHQQAPPPAPPVPEPIPVTTTVTTSTSTSTSTSTGTATIEVPVAALQQVHEILGKIIGGQDPQVSTGGVVGPSDPQPEGGVPFSVPRPKRGEKACKICFRKFWSTDTLKKHIKTHTGDQKYSCANPGCGRKVASKRGLEVHMTTCQKEKTLFCRKKGCTKLFSTKAGLKAHVATHQSLSKQDGVCKGCGKTGFTKQKSLDDHYRTCSGNPDHVGPFPCPVSGCRRGPAKPFTSVRNLNLHLKTDHGYNPKHV